MTNFKNEAAKAINALESMELNDYNSNANNFLIETETIIKITYTGREVYFSDDKEMRSVYKIELRNAKHKYSFRFGQSIFNSNKGIAPTPYDILSCLQKNEVGSFDDFCNEYGYYPIEDSSAFKSVRKTYKAVLKEWKNVELLFTEKEIELLQEIN